MHKTDARWVAHVRFMYGRRSVVQIRREISIILSGDRSPLRSKKQKAEWVNERHGHCTRPIESRSDVPTNVGKKPVHRDRPLARKTRTDKRMHILSHYCWFESPAHGDVWPRHTQYGERAGTGHSTRNPITRL